MSSTSDRARAYADANEIADATDNLEAALTSGVEAAYVSSTNEKHFEQTMAALAAGLHVMCEKPLAMSADDARQMTAAADRAGLVLATNHHLRNSAVHKAMRQLIAEGEIGELLAVRVAHAVLLPERLRGWRLDNPGAGGGIPLDITVHDIDTIRFVTGLEPTKVAAVGVNQGMASDLPDAVVVSGVLGENVTFSTHDAFTVPHALTGFEVHGSQGSLIGTGCMTPNPVGSLSILRNGVREEITLPAVDNLYVPNIQAFVAAVDGKGAPIASGDDGRRSLEVALAVVMSLNTGRSIDLDLESRPLLRQDNA